MEILIVSNGDACRSRMAEEILNSFGRGMKISTAGVLTGNTIPDAVCNVMEQNGYSLSRRKPCEAGMYLGRSWDCVITLCPEAEEVEKEMVGEVKQRFHLSFDDPFRTRISDESEQEQQVMSLYNVMYRELFRFFRSELNEQLIPRCTCGANTYCRCE